MGKYQLVVGLDIQLFLLSILRNMVTRGVCFMCSYLFMLFSFSVLWTHVWLSRKWTYIFCSTYFSYLFLTACAGDAFKKKLEKVIVHSISMKKKEQKYFWPKFWCFWCVKIKDKKTAKIFFVLFSNFFLGHWSFSFRVGEIWYLV